MIGRVARSDEDDSFATVQSSIVMKISTIDDVFYKYFSFTKTG